MKGGRAEQALASAEALDAVRAPWDALWQELADVIHPRRGLITRRPAENSTPERDRIAEAFDGTAMRANRTLANGQASRITPMGARWFALRPPEELAGNHSAVAWYQRCGEILARKLAASNFYNRAHEHYLDRGCFGLAATEITAGKYGRGLHFRSFPVGSFSIAHDSQDEVDTLYRTSRLLAAFRATFTTDHGRTVLAVLRASAGCGKPSFLPPPGGGSYDPIAAAFRDGRKSILDEIQTHLDTPEDAGPEAKPSAIKS